jgi:hypothetical protein
MAARQRGKMGEATLTSSKAQRMKLHALEHKKLYQIFEFQEIPVDNCWKLHFLVNINDCLVWKQAIIWTMILQ